MDAHFETHKFSFKDGRSILQEPEIVYVTLLLVEVEEVEIQASTPYTLYESDRVEQAVS